MRKLFFIISSLFTAINIQAQTKQAITHESMWMMKRVGIPEVSPDGKWVVFDVNEPSYDEKEIVRDLWIAPADGSAKPRKLTNTKTSENGYKWSPDGKYIVFAAKRDGEEVFQLYLLNVKDGGEAQRITNLSTGATVPRWSPDGKMLLFTSRVYQGAFTDADNKRIADDKKKIKYKARVYTTFPIRNFDKWIDDKQIHIFVQSPEQGSHPKDVFENVAIARGEGFDIDSTSICWSADNKEIIFSATTDRTSAAYQSPTTNLYKVSIAGGDATQLTSGGTDYTRPVVSSNGEYLFCFTSANNNYKVYNINNLVRFDWPSLQNKTVLTAKLDRPVNSYKIDNSNTVYMSVEDEGNDKLFSIKNGTIQPLTNTPGSYNDLSVSGNGNVIVSDYESSVMPAEVVRINESSKNYSFISDFNAEQLKNLDITVPEIVWFTSSRGKKIRSLLIKPPAFDAKKRYPLLVVMHGGPAGAWKDNWGYRWNYQLLAAPGYVLVMTDYTGSTGYGEKFSQDIQYDPFKGPADEINEAAKDVIKKYSFIEGSRQAAAGASYGGHLANWMEATTSHYKCLVCHAGLVNSEAQYGTSDVVWSREVMNGGAPWTQTKTWKEQNPIRYAANFKTPILVTVGENDFRVPINNSLENWSVLQRMKVPGKLIIFPEENHWITKAEDSRFFYSEMQNWLKKYL